MRLAESARRLAPLLLLALWGCGDEPSYFPLKEDWSWGYRVTLFAQGRGERVLKSFVANLAPREIGGKAVTPRLHHDGHMRYYAAEAGGVRQVGFGSGGGRVIPAPDGAWVFKRPLAPGTSWKTPTQTQLLRHRFLFDMTMPVLIDVDMAYTIAAVDDAVTVPAGRFDGCLRIEGHGTTRLKTRDHMHTLNVEITTTDWLAPGVGLVKSVRSETAGYERTGNGTRVMELEVVDRGSWFD